MGLNLTIDQGNTAAKIALWRDSELVDLRIENSLDSETLRRFVDEKGEAVDRAIYCSVARCASEIERILKPVAAKVVHVCSSMPLPVKIAYGTPGTLGEDRIASAVGARVTFPDEDLLVVDAGTAVTYDAVTANGHFIGGNIAPGISMRLEALHRFTARLPRVEMPHVLNIDAVFGNDTRSAMVLGAVYGIVGSVAYYRSKLPDGCRVVMTGGWARELSRICDFDVHVDPDLASKGLNRILLYNENI